MILQKILFADDSPCKEPLMFFRPYGDNGLALNTYFNAFSLCKWRQYTKLSNLRFIVRTVQKASVRARGMNAEEDIVLPLEAEETSCVDGSFSYTLDFSDSLDFKGLLYAVLESEGSEPVRITGGEWETSVSPEGEGDIKIAVGITTFKREKEVERNIRVLANCQAVDSVLVVDNARSLSDTMKRETASCGTASVNFYENRNVGGSGGFTRAMIEAFFSGVQPDFTHIILMDDDVVFSCDAVERTRSFLAILKDEYSDSALYGVMFNINDMKELYSAGGIWKGNALGLNMKNCHSRLDMTDASNVFESEADAGANYSSWWYACFPRSVIRPDNLPMPFFLHFDDIEYGVRNKSNGLIFLNGVAVWHPLFIQKNPLWIKYYEYRNTLILLTSGFSRKSKKDFFSSVMTLRHRYDCFIGPLLHYDYDAVEVLVLALEDFLLGPDSFMALDAEKKHRELSRFSRRQYVEEESLAGEIRCVCKGRVFCKPLALLLELISFCVPFRKQGLKYIEATGKRSDFPYLYDALYVFDTRATVNSGYVLKRDRNRTRNLYKRFAVAYRTLKKNYDGLSADWDRAKPVMTSLPFWKRYLNLC